MNCASGQDSREINSVLGGTTLASITGKEDTVKSQFITREGTYKLMNSSDYCRTNRVGYTATPQTITPVKCSFVHLPGSPNNCDKICFNVGKDLYVYNYKGVKKATDLSKPIDKRSYKGTLPTCHDFNQLNVSSDCVYLLVGFSAGQIQLVDPIKKEISKLYNEERLIDKTKVTCIKWAPGSMNLFLVSHSSGQLYVYKEDLPCGSTPPHYQIFKQGEGFSVYTCKAKSTRNPLYRWVIGEGSINEIAFSPCSNYLAVVSEDGFLRVFNYDTMELVGRVRSYFGGLLCVCWSPDSKFVVVGGEDDLVTVWSLPQKRVIARGQGHKSWVSVVAFDPFTTTVKQSYDSNASDDEVKSDVQVHSIGDSSSIPHNHHFNTTSSTTSTSNNSSSNSNKIPRNSPTSIVDSNQASSTNHRSVTATSTVTKSTTFSSTTSSPASITSYRFGSVGQDTQICLWELTEDIIKQNVGRSRTSILLSSPTPGTNAIGLNMSGLSLQPSNNFSSQSGKGSNQSQANCMSNNFPLSETNAYNHTTGNHTISRTTASEIKKEHKRNFSLASRSSDKNSLNKASHSRLLDDPIRLLGTSVCPRLDEVPLLEPLICKKIAHERLTSLVFREDCFVTACQEGYVFTWARPTRWESIQIAPSPTPSIGGDVNEVSEECGSTVV